MLQVAQKRATVGKPSRRLLSGLFVLLLLASAVGPAFSSPASRATAQEAPSGDVIVVLEDEPAVSAAAAEATVEAEADEAGVEPVHTYTEVFNGFSASVTPDQAEDLANDPDVVAIFPDLPIRAAAQTVPNNIKRAGANQNATARIDGVDQRVNADVAILDSGIDLGHSDLNVVGGVDCVDEDTDPNTYDDVHGHGTHVAGIAAAKDNASAVVGVAPGARLWSVRVLGFSNGNAVGTVGSLICGLDWVYARRGTIDVVNLSVEGRGPDTTCGVDFDPLHEAICKVVNAGVPIAVAAGNFGINVNADPAVIPATYKEVITVSALTDSDGAGGGDGPPCNGDTDDTFAPFSDFGSDVDMAAPGNCILSTTNGGGIGLNSGTSMASPHVAGAIALFEASSPGASVASIRNWLMTISAMPQSSTRGISGDPDSNREPVLWLGPDTKPRVVLSPSKGTVNSWMTATVVDFPPNHNVWVRWDGELIGKWPISSNGTAVVRFRIPADTMGEHSVRFAAGDVAIIAPYVVTPRIKLIPDSRPRGWGVEVSLRGYAPHEMVRIRWLKGSTWVERARVRTSSTGSANIRIYVPSWAPNGTAKVRGDGTFGRAQTNAFVVSGGSFNPGTSPTKTPTPTPTPSPTATATVPPDASPVVSETVPAETPATVVETPTDVPTQAPTELLTETPTPTVCVPPSPTPLVPAAVHETGGAPDAHVVFDQNPGTSWFAPKPAEGENPAEIVADLGTQAQIDKIRWLVGDPNSAAGMIVSVSNDGANWQTLANPADVTPGDWRELVVASGWRFVRFQFPNPNGAEQVGGLAEVEVLPPVATEC